MCRRRRWPHFSALGSVLLGVTLAAGLPDPAAARYASLVMDANTGRVLHSVNADTRNYPASLTKMMTLYLVFEALEKGKLKLGTRLPVSHRAARQPSSRLGLKAGTSITVKQAILSLVVKSANDVATVVAEGLAGSEKAFARTMTAKARRLGMGRTTFRNASGLPHRAQLGTARDMATLARALIRDFPQYYGYFSVREFRFRGARHRSHNRLLRTYAGTDGLKTGYIRASGFNLAASVKRGDRRLIGVVFGGRSPRSRNRHMVNLLEKGFRSLAIGFLAGVTPPRPKRPGDAVPARLAAAAPVDVRGQGDAEQDPARASLAGTWGIQVGAYKTPTPARVVADRAVAHAPNLLEDGVVRVVPLAKRGGRMLYRARVLGLGRREAYRACRVLKKRRIDCMEIKVTGSQFEAASG